MPKLVHPRSPQTVVDVSDERAETLTSRGYQPANGSGKAGMSANEKTTTLKPGEQVTSKADTDSPNVSDRKAAWVDYAVANGMDRDEAEDLTKDELVAHFG